LGAYNAPKRRKFSVRLIAPFKELGRPEQAAELLKYYIEQRADEGPKFFELKGNIFGSEVKDPDVRAAFAVKATNLKPKIDAKELLLKIGRSRGWNPEELEELAKLGPAEFKTLFNANLPNCCCSIDSAWKLKQRLKGSRRQLGHRRGKNDHLASVDEVADH
jgi:hypothetical protein